MPTPALMVVLACGLDRVVGDPTSFPHPVRVMGWTIQALRNLCEAWAGDIPWKLRLGGGALTLVLTLGSGLAGWLIEELARTWPGPGSILLVVGMASALAGRSLERAVRDVSRALPDLPLARARLAWIVGREVEGLPEAEILRAAAETTAENAVDGLFAPLFWMMVGAVVAGRWPGAPGPLALAWIFKASSTLDSMLGYRRGRLRWLGTAGARLDDVLTWIPTRLVALTLPLLTPTPWNALSMWREATRQGASDPSPNAGVSQAAYALAARVRLGGANRYADGWREKPVLCPEFSPPTQREVDTMLSLTWKLEGVWLLVFVALNPPLGAGLQ